MWADRGLLNEKPGLYDPGRIAAAGLDTTEVVVEHVPGVNHYSILFDDDAVARVAGRILEMAAVHTDRL
jgi:hypothetical protein